MCVKAYAWVGPTNGGGRCSLNDFVNDRSRFDGPRDDRCSLNERLDLLEVAFPARFLEKLSVGYFVRLDPNIVISVWGCSMSSLRLATKQSSHRQIIDRKPESPQRMTKCRKVDLYMEQQATRCQRGRAGVTACTGKKLAYVLNLSHSTAEESEAAIRACASWVRADNLPQIERRRDSRRGTRRRGTIQRAATAISADLN